MRISKTTSHKHVALQSIIVNDCILAKGRATTRYALRKRFSCRWISTDIAGVSYVRPKKVDLSFKASVMQMKLQAANVEVRRITMFVIHRLGHWIVLWFLEYFVFGAS